jgi:hypothetical protein
MTLPDERYRAMRLAQGFLQDLCNCHQTPRVIRERARSILRHYPTAWHLDQLAEHAPDVIRKEIEPLTRMVMKYDQDKS